MEDQKYRKVSLVAKCATNEIDGEIYLNSFLDDIREDRWKDIVEVGVSKDRTKRPGQNQSDYTTYKSNSVPACTIHGTFHYREDASLKERNYIAALDFDHVQNISQVKQKIESDQYTYSVFISFGRDGLCVLAQVDPSQSHDIAHAGLRQYFLSKYNLICDENAKDLARLRCVSHDPDLYINEDSLVWSTPDNYIPKKKPELLSENNHRAQILPMISSRLAKGDTVDEVEALINAAHIDPVSCMNDPEEVTKLIIDVQQRYFKGREGKGIETVQYCGFWTNNFTSSEIQLSTGLLLDVLISLGYSILDGDFVNVQNGIISKVSKTDLYVTIINLASYQDITFQVKDKKITIGRTALKTRAQTSLRGSVSIFALPKFNREIMRDSAREVFFHFKNVSFSITPNGIETFKRDSEKCIFEKQVIPHDFNETDDEYSQFHIFIKNIAGDNFDAFTSSIGYALRNYNGSDGMRALWLCDETFNAGKNNGRSGKSLYAKAIARIRKTDECSGKDLDERSVFKFQNVSRDTQVYAIEDVRSGFDFSILFTACTEGLEYQAKHRDRIKLSMAETPKIIITSNRSPKIEDGSSMMGRLIILPVKSHYVPHASKGGVKFEHGHTFFDDWDNAEWCRFFSFMALCVESYLKNGLLEADMTEVRKNRLKELLLPLIRDGQTTDDFIEWIYEKLPVGDINPEELRSFWIDHSGEDTVSAMVFGKLIKCYLDVEGIGFSKKRVGKGEARKTVYFAG